MLIFLTGFMGAGKSLLGKCLAKRLGLGYLDMDVLLEEVEGKTIQQIFAEKGESYFRDLEAKLLREMTQYSNMIVSTGGGIPCYNDNMEWMNDHGITIYLDVSPMELARRLMNESDKRPLLNGKTPEELKKFIHSKLQERSYYYNQAQFVCNAGHTVDELVEGLAGYFKRFFPESREK